MPQSDAAHGTLWVRYVDWCSAQVARRLLELSPEEFWERAERITRIDRDTLPRSRAEVPIARQLAVELYQELDLPPFPRWCEEYQREPSRFDPDILGFQAPTTVCVADPTE